jgi:hypothetical protein
MIQNPPSVRTFVFLIVDPCPRRQQVEGATISTIAKGRFTAQLDVMQKEVFVEKKALLAARVEQEVEAVKQVRSSSLIILLRGSLLAPLINA